MEIFPLPADESVIRRYVEQLWLPYHRELEATVDRHALATDVDVLGQEIEYRRNRLKTPGYRIWIAVDTSHGDRAGENPDLLEADLAGFLTAEIDESSPVFDRPDRLVIGDIYVKKRYRDTGVARELLSRARDHARESGCTELALDVDVDNERALAFYGKVGFTPVRHRMAVPVDATETDRPDR